jgi:RHS repeat-associated protein
VVTRRRCARFLVSLLFAPPASVGWLGGPCWLVAEFVLVVGAFPLALATQEPPPPVVTPDSGYQKNAANATGRNVTFFVENWGIEPETYSLTCGVQGAVTSCSKPSTVTVGPGSLEIVDVVISTGAPQIGRVSLTAWGAGGSDGGYSTITVQDSSSQPTSSSISINPTSHNGDYRDVKKCLASCFDASVSATTAPYFSMDAPRSVTLLYRSSQAKPMGFVQVDATDNTSPAPDTMSIRLKRPDGSWVTFTNGSPEIFYIGGSGTSRLAAQFDASSLATGVNRYTVVARSWRDGSFQEATYPIRVLITNEQNSPFGWGWSIPGFQQLYVQTDGSVVITEGDGSIGFFEIDVCGSACLFTSPPGDLTTVKTIGTWPATTGYQRKYADGTVVTFNSGGRLTSIRDRFGNQTSYGYDGSNRLSTITDPANKAHTFGYGADGKLDWIHDPGTPNRYTYITIDGAFNVTQITDPANVAALRLTYDGAHRVKTQTDRRGGVWGFAYDFAGKLAADTMPTITADGQSVRPVVQFSPLERAVLVDPTSGAGTLANPAPRVIPGNVQVSNTDPRGHVTIYTLDRLHQPLTVTDALGRLTTITRDAKGLPTVVSYPSGRVDSTTYDATGLVTSQRIAGLARTFFRYGSFAQPDSVWGTGQPAARRFVNTTNGRVDSVRTSGNPNLVMRYTYDTQGRVIEARDHMSHLLGKTWYAGVNGNRSKDSLPGGRLTTYGYDTYGRRTTVSAAGRATVTTYYSIINRPDSVRDGVNALPTRYAYDQLFLTSVTDPKGQVYGFTYNALGWVTQRTDPVGRTEQFAYDRDGLLGNWTNRRGQQIDRAYDALHRLTTKVGSETADETWTYSPNGRVVTGSNAIVTQTWHYGLSGVLDSAKTAFAGMPANPYRVRYTYTPAGLLDSVIPTGAGISFQTRTYEYDASKFTLDTIRLGTLVTDISTNNDGQPTSVRLPGGEAMTYRFTVMHSEGELGSGPSYEGTTARFLSFDAGQRIWRHVVGSGIEGVQYAYDGLGRLKSVADIWFQGPNPCAGGEDMDENGNQCTYEGTWVTGAATSFAYDSAGNRRDKSGQYGTGNRITNFDGCSYQTDFDGNVTQRGCSGETVDFTWTAEGWMSSLTVNGQTTTFDYDAAGRLVRKTTGATVRHFLWEGDNLLAELDGAGTGKVAELSYYPGLDAPHAVIVGTTAYFAHQDGVGSVIALTDTAEAVKRTYVYDPWGSSVGGTDYVGFADADRARFKGALWLGPGLDLYYMRARWYEPKSGRFLSEDPIGLEGGVNPYVYAGDDPINGRDPTGTCDEDEELWAWYYDNDGDHQLSAGDRIIGYYCTGGGGGGGVGGGGGGAGQQTQQVPPQMCPVPPVAPPDADINANIRKAQSASLNVYYGNPFVTDAWFGLTVANGGAWDYKQQADIYDPFGNFNYGATGRAAGYSASTLLRMSGWAAEKYDARRSGNPSLVQALLGQPYPENPDDRANIVAGMQYYQNGCYQR